MRTGRSIRNTLLILAAIFLYWSGSAAGRAYALETGEADIYALIEAFTWREFDGGIRAVKESGPRVGLGAAYTAELPGNIFLRPRGEFYFGQVDYDGSAQDLITGAVFPAMSDTNYFGFKLEGDVGTKVGGEFRIGPFVGLGLNTWWRDIEDSVAFNPTSGFFESVAGYTEFWTTFYARLGILGDLRMSQTSKMFFEAVLKLPLYNQNFAYFSDIGYSDDIVVEPGRKTSFFAEVGLKLQMFKISAFYDSMRFSESDVDITFHPFIGPVLFVQPKSEADIYGIRIGASF